MWETGAKSKQKCTVSIFRNQEPPFRRCSVDEFTVSEAKSPTCRRGLTLFFDPHNYLDAQCPDLIPNRVTRIMPF
jgi:hypothetical protein